MINVCTCNPITASVLTSVPTDTFLMLEQKDAAVEHKCINKQMYIYVKT